MGQLCLDSQPIPTSILPLKGRKKNALRAETWPTLTLPLKGKECRINLRLRD
jgi:hypothetical protein